MAEAPSFVTLKIRFAKEYKAEIKIVYAEHDYVQN
jgi:hypothetical protein